MKKITLQVQNKADRDPLVLALANSGYCVRAFEQRPDSASVSYDYYVEFIVTDLEVKDV